ncbi:hypothetical protein BGI41_08250 [Methanobrevibacter sp. 87.7]|uniref:hypothetical protein n=1 Tax=Methanobrevibacter sp. 87.7 TaxID=387957 RepID=UPI000B50E333|nr:hypothetical protein [Methanobrevibacter sp. 87.7]OWT32325.1 hypothetical protein BGI41_08250 [Methanobrevibacter sp. 87.7]
MSKVSPDEFDKEADEIFKRISNKRMAEIKKLEMKYDKEFKKYDKIIDKALEDELNTMEKRIKQQTKLLDLKNKRKYLNKIRFLNS